MRTLYGIGLTLLAGACAASATEDVIYKQDGTILRGSLIEQNFQDGIYKIEIQGGSVFVVKADDITKITKEKPLGSSSAQTASVQTPATNSSGNAKLAPALAPAPTPTQKALTYSESQPETPVTYATFGVTNKPTAKYPNHVVHYGMSHRTYHLDTQSPYGFEQNIEWQMQGQAYAYQLNFNKNWSTYLEYSDTRLDEITDEDGFAYTVSYSERKDIRATLFQALAVLSSNNDYGWQFYAGGGMFRDRLNFGGRSYRAVGSSVLLGMGYAWQHVQMHFRLTFPNSNDYPSEFSKQSGSALQLGYRF